ncbi:DEAD/DEAH box helicase [Nocardiopsis dassonvillei]|uniref:DEAD/DEAH box helicase domain protein n=1 Tax=Nocardiopsis dassonvillei (strain ATCC 23218 / DSM 43111 / CIP 107115 / JCM 7437 / KCTC 9190 / NBRC 14626 / NCTC 10488 / NRRL B-5397 / IMRU 509) TaxID=446468 RepID=D7B943_NOCDD|nr:DEAD/DEAH box helicase [Nocardiopsis dassonvillei]ADH70701.1 DEAD/DEAH box helicase domain protein [Nocardiopsis dassonvillei subsp. dassonvillei DSM 43111]VEI90910.1 ATP-dependent DNA helicase recQ [Nocardiopsis dassonvillei]
MRRPEPVLPGVWRDDTRYPQVTHIEHVARNDGVSGEWPVWTAPHLVERLADRGITGPWSHQAEAADLARSGRDVIIATGTASGKSLAFLLPAADAIDAGGTVLYLSPTKALAQDQLRWITDLSLPGMRTAVYDGDTPAEERSWVREHGNYVLTNPDMLHHGILPRHGAWARFLRRLRYVVIDEAHRYRGVFGSHVAQILRRLRRVCARYRSRPVFVLASATSGSPAESAARLTGVPVTAVSRDGSPRPGMSVALVEPELTDLTGEHGAPIRRTAPSQAAEMLADLVRDGVRTLVFVRSRQGAEVVALTTQRLLAERGDHALAGRVAAYRGGYLASERRELEEALRSGEILGLASTNALELGVDISGLDAVLIAGWPGTLASLWQQAGRAGRRGEDALAVFIARDDPLDTYLAHHPEAIFGRSVEATVLDPENPHILGPHLCAAAQELPITKDDFDLFGATTEERLAELVERRLLRRRPRGWFWTSNERASDLADIRGSGGPPVQIVDTGSGQLLGEVDEPAAHGTVHPGAVYLHQGYTYLVDDLDLDEGVALVHPAEPPYSTWARDTTDITVRSVLRQEEWPSGATVYFGEVQVVRQVVGFLRRDVRTGSVLGEQSLDLPERTLDTRAVWWTLPAEGEERLRREDVGLLGAAHAAEHAAIGLLPLLATCDRWDIGGVSTSVHGDTGRLTVFVYDGYEGGAGFAERGYAAAREWLSATRAAIADCECDQGCPSCIQSPKCGNGNEPLSKAGALRLLDEVLADGED